MKVLPKKHFKYKKIKLDKKDKTILYYLTKNTRIPLSKIAKLSRTSRDTLNYRITRLKTNQLIVGSRTAINTRSLGYLSFHIFLELPEMSDTNMEKIIEKIKQNKDINLIITYSGKWNMEIGVFTKKPEEFRNILAEVFSQINIKNYRILMLTDTIKATILPDDFFKDITTTSNALNQFKNDISFHKDFLNTNKSKAQIDDIDKQILSHLSQNALIKIKDLARKTKIAKETAISRIKKLIHNKIIIDFRPVINYFTLGLSVQALLLKLSSTGRKDLKKIEEFIKNKPNILWAVHTIGESDILIYTLTESVDQFHTLINEFRNQFPDEIDTFDPLFAYEEHKYLFYPERP